MDRDVLSKTAEQVIKDWLKAPYDEETRKEVKELMQKDPKEANDAFTTELKFGTAGLRAKMGPGPGRMNKYTIQKATQGLANYILNFPKSEYENGVVVCHDSRNHSRDFAIETARVLAGNKIRVHLVPELRPTPFASFSLRHFKCIAGINITASHNPKEYNGYKVYWRDGAQIVPPHETAIIQEMEKITSLSQIKAAKEDSPLISLIPPEVDVAYLDAVKGQMIDHELCQRFGKDLKIVYSPLNGAGITMIPDAFKMWGFRDVHVVEEQKKPDGNFPTTPYPNPEMDAALKLSWRDLVNQQADISLVSDPDSDRLSCSLLVDKKPVRLTGNELGALLLHYILLKRKPKGRFATVTTIVSSSLIKEMTEKNGGTCFEVLTGFKYIGEKIHQWESEKNGYDFLFGMEESLGYLYGTFARDKDATIAACLTAELTLSLKKENKTLLDQLYILYATYGIHRETQMVIESKEGLDALVKKMDALRKEPPKKLCGQKVLSTEDYKVGKMMDHMMGKENPIDLPKANVLVFKLEDETKLILRPSGTEPKLKIYIQVKNTTHEVSEESIKALDEKMAFMLKDISHAYFR